MKYISLILLPFTAIAQINPSLPVVRVDNGQVIERRAEIPQRYGSTVNYQSASYRWLSDGWRQWVQDSCAAGLVETGETWIITEATAIQTVQCGEPPPAVPSPATFSQGIETPWIVLESVTNQTGWLYIALDDGTLAPVLAHNSPWPTEAVIKQRIAEAQTKANANRSKAKSEMNGQIQQRVENLERLMGIRP